MLERAVHELTGAPAVVLGASRTDAGVHARAQVASFATETSIPLLGIVRGLNSALPHDVAVRDGEEVDSAFDARRHARSKRYLYLIWNRPERSPLWRRTSWHLTRPLDVGAMRRGAAPLLGEHDFSAFRAAGCSARHPVRTLHSLDVSGEDLITLSFQGNAFLRHMVRNIAGTLAEVGLGRRPPEEVAGILDGRDRTRAGRTAPAKGLTLWAVYY